MAKSKKVSQAHAQIMGGKGNNNGAVKRAPKKSGGQGKSC